ncbi:MAG: Epimerase family protein [Flavobacteriaceae bacterium]|nr:MAG: Epimerase family protein [Flavobacteriaceae bacterium]
MTILITGATGLIGTALSKRLLDQGHTIHFLTTRKEKILNTPTHKGYYWNPTIQEIDLLAFTDVSCIVNLVGATIAKRWTPSYKKVVMSSRVQTTNLLYKSLKELNHGVTSFISASGISLYPNAERTLYSETATEVAANFLGEVVVAWEAAADQFKDLGVGVAKIRTGVVFDAILGAFPRMIQPIKMGVPSVVGTGSQWISWIHTDDVVAIYNHAIDQNLTGVYNAVAPEAINNKEFTQLVAEFHKIPMWAPRLPGFLLKLFLGAMSILALEGQRVSVLKLENTGFTFKYPTLDKALNSLLKK